ncbi:MAG: OstA-like protein [Chitinophagales bacterium]|nr:hypothetical protein [Bacteroidota bacterium]MCB9226309.1 hypothetical protein [Chitinophagales bacterium]
MLQKFFFTFSLIFLGVFLFAQKTVDLSTNDAKEDTSSYKEVEIIHADKLQFNTLPSGVQIRKLVGNVELKHDSTLMYCDSAYIYTQTNTVDAWGHIHINNNDSIHAYSNTLKYDGNTRKAKLIGNARLEDGSKTLYSDVLNYDMKNEIGSYNTGGKLDMDSTVLTSKIGYYYTKTKVVHFKDSVLIIDPEYRLESDTMHYFTQTKVAKFYGPTTIYNNSSTINCVLGTYDTNREIATFGKGTVINNAPQTLYSDSLYYERFRGYGKTFYYFDFNDIEMKAGMEGTTAEYFENNQEIIAYNRPMLKVDQDGDTLFLRGDIIHTKENPEHGFKEFWSFNSVRIFKSDLQGIADSLFFSYQDSIMRMFDEPILWNENNQMLGDTIFVYTVNEKVDKVRFFENGFVSMFSKGDLFDQIRGKTITALFKDNEMQKMIADKNAESLYYGKNDDEEYVGANNANSERIIVYMKEKEVDHITFIKEPEALFTPMRMLSESNKYLKGFTWHIALRPKDKFDL